MESGDQVHLILVCICIVCNTNLGVELQKPDFQSELSKKLHNNYWSKSDVSRKVIAEKTSPSVLSADVANAPVASSVVAPTLAAPQLDQKPAARLVSTTKMKNDILDSYQKRFGAPYPHRITTTAQGTFPITLLQPPLQS